MDSILSKQQLILQAFATLADATPNSMQYKKPLQFSDKKSLDDYIKTFNDLLANHSDEQLAQILLETTGLNVTDSKSGRNIDNMRMATAFIKSNSANRVGAILDLVEQLDKVKTAPTAEVATNPTQTISLASGQSKELALTTGRDILIGSSQSDVFKADIQANVNTLQSDDKLDGGAGRDALHANIGTPHKFIVTPETKSVEDIKVRAQAFNYNGQEVKDNSQQNYEVRIDAQRMKDVLSWENYNSRADLLIENVRIKNNQITKDITITMRETDPGHVDYGVYFDQYSLRNVANSTSHINIQILDTRAAVTGEDNLKGNESWGLTAFNFFVSNDGGVTFKPVSLGNDEVKAARTVEQMRDALQKAADEKFSTGDVTVALGEDYTVTDTTSGRQTTAKQITLSAKSDLIFDATNAHGKSGWTITNLPSDMGLHSKWNQDSSSTDLVSSTIVLDDVGHGSTGGDLVIGSLSVGDASSPKGVGRFEIEVQDDSKLQTISSTNNTLQEVTIKNGVQDRQADAYNPIDKAGGKLVVNGQVNTTAPGATDLPGRAKSLYGFQDVRIIDASFMGGKLEFTAHLSTTTIDKYLNLKESQPNPSHESIKIEYTSGFNNDKMIVDLDAEVAASRNKINVDQADFEFMFNGGAGNDEISVALDRHDIETTTEGAKHKLKDMSGFDTVLGTDSNIRKGNTEAWYHEQKANNKITINGGTGDDVLKKPGAGDTYFFGGAGHDTIYADNTGADAVKIGGKDLRAKAIWVFNTEDQANPAATTRTLGDLKSAALKTVGSYGVEVRVNYRGLLSEKVAIDDKVDFKASQLDINQAIKKAINDDAVLNKLLQAEDDPAGTLVVFSKVDGVHTAAALNVEFFTPDSISKDIVDRYNQANGTNETTRSIVNTIKANVTNNSSTSLAKIGYHDTQLGLTDTSAVIDGAASVTTSDNVIEGVTGDDVIVLGTTVGANELASSNDLILFYGEFGHDTIVNFATTGDGLDKLDFTTVGGKKDGFIKGVSTSSGFKLNVTEGRIQMHRLRVEAGSTVSISLNDNDTADDVKQLFVDGYKAARQLYIAVDTTTGTGDVYQVIDGPVAKDLQVNLLGHITLVNDANTGTAFDWNTLTPDNFVI